MDFQSDLFDGSKIPLKIEISSEPHRLLHNVYNLAFGPPDVRGKIDDKAELQHSNYSKVFSTILFTGLTYLNSNPGHFLGIDGSSNSRAYLYYRFLQKNYDYLNRFFNLFGIKYYVRVTRFGKTQYDDPFDFQDVKAIPESIEKKMIVDPKFMFNYFIFNKN